MVMIVMSEVSGRVQKFGELVDLVTAGHFLATPSVCISLAVVKPG